jgi:CheY-like chemotaxis protein
MGDTRRVLVVEDDRETTQLIRETLAAQQWQVEVCTSGLDAAAMLRAARYNLVIANIYLPGLSGTELFEAASRVDARLRRRFLFVGGVSESPAVKNFLQESGCAIIRKPIQADELLLLAEHLGGAKPLAKAGEVAKWFSPEDLNLYSGEIAGRHTLFRLLHRIYVERLTGVLHVVLGRVEKKLYFNRGNLIFAASNLYSEGLGEMLLRAGVISLRDFEDATAHMDAGRRFGPALLELGVCNRDELTEYVRQQVTHIATSVFDFPAGRYYFFDTFEEDLAPEVGIALPVGRLMLATARTAPDLPLGELAREQSALLDYTTDPLLRLQDVELNEPEQRLMATLVEPMSPAELIATSELDTKEAARALYALLALGMIAVRAPDAAPAEKARAAPQDVAAAAPAETVADMEAFEKEMKRLVELAEAGTYYELLDVPRHAPAAEIVRRFNELARKFHPDRHKGNSQWIGTLHHLMDAFTRAYKTLTDDALRGAYDRQFAEATAAAAAKPAAPAQKQTGESCMTKAMECLCVKDISGAIQWLRRATELEPNVSRYRTKLARLLAALPQYRHEAFEQYEKAIELEPWNTSAYFQLAELFMEMQLPWRAKPLYEKILEIDPEHTKARRRLAEIEPGETAKEAKAAPLVSRLFRRQQQ